MITMIGVGIIGHQAPVEVTSNLSFAKGFLAVTDIVSVFVRHNALDSNLSSDLRLCRPRRFLHFHRGNEGAK